MSLFVRGLAIRNYRSVRNLRLPVERLSVFLGANGVGKTNLYRALQLLQGAAAGTLGSAIAGERVDFDPDLMASETALGRLADPSRFPDLQLIRQTLLDWRFYHDLRTDPGSPLRQPALAVASPTLSSDGSNLAAVFATLAHI